MVQQKLKQKINIDLKKLANSEFAHNLSRHLNGYEQRVKRLVNDFEVKSREARDKGQKQLDKFAGQLRRTRTDLEKRVSTMFHAESKRLNEGANELFNYLKRIAKSEKLVGKAHHPKKKSRAHASDTHKKASGRKRTPRKSASHEASSHAS